MGSMMVVGSGMVIVMTMVINNKWLLCLRIHTHTHTHTRSHTHLYQTLKSLVTAGIMDLQDCSLLHYVCMYDCKKKNVLKI